MNADEKLNAARSMAKVVARKLAWCPGLHHVLWRIPHWRPRTLASALHFERRRRRHVRTMMRRIREIEADVVAREPRTGADEAPIVLFNTTTSPGWISFTSMVGMLTGWALRLDGQRIVNWVCHSGMLRCPQGTYRYATHAPPPCAGCRSVKDAVFGPAAREAFGLDSSIGDRLRLPDRVTDIAELAAVTYKGIEIGRLCLPTVRHVLRRHGLPPDEATVGIYKDFLLSAANIVDRFGELVDRVRPKAAVMFNGVVFPEATARAVALRHGIPVTTYEVGFRDRSALFSGDLAPECRLEIPPEFELGEREENECNAYLSRRFGGDFTMGGVKFWPEMKGLGDAFAARAKKHKQVVSVFTNTVFDTSQVSANTVFGSMFEWLGATLELGRTHPDTLFVVRAHPDEFRRGNQRSWELVGDWLEENGFLAMPNLLFIAPTELVSSYELLGVSKFSIVYNSTIGLEAVMVGVPLLCGGSGKYSNTSFARVPATVAEYAARLAELLDAESPAFSAAWQNEARRFLYYLFFKASLDLSRFVAAPDDGLGFRLADFSVDALTPSRSREIRAILGGIVNAEGFHYDGAAL